MRLEAAAVGLGRGQEHRKCRTRDHRGDPRRLGNVLAHPEPAQDQCKDQLGDEERLDDRELPTVECDRLKRESPGRSSPTEEPERLADEEHDETPVPVPVGHTETRGVLGHEVHRVGQGGRQGEGDCHGHVVNSDRALR